MSQITVHVCPQSLLFHFNMFIPVYRINASIDTGKMYHLIVESIDLHFSVLDTMSRWSMIKNIHSPNLVGIGSWGPEIWRHEYLLSPIEISVNWPVPNSYEPGQFTLISMGLIRYSCGHILGHHEPIHVKFGVWRFFIMLYRNMVMKMLKCKQFFFMMSHFGTLFPLISHWESYKNQS